jgi:glycosyltransferase involved in cell wall biosynthesis
MPSSARATGVVPGGPRVAVLIPCRNEERTVAAVVRDFRAALPGAAIHVCDNNSTDDTIAAARAAGAAIGHETLQGKGNVVRRMFADVEADIYVLVDGDGTYDPRSAPLLVEALLDNRLDLVNGMRAAEARAAFRPGHRASNVLLSRIIALVFGNRFRDTLSGYKVFSRRFVKSFPAHASGFDIEAELIVHALELGMPVQEIETPYAARTGGSSSKLRTVRDGVRVLCAIAILIKEERPLTFFAWIFLLLAAGSILLAAPVIATYSQTGLVPRMPTAVLATGIMLLAFLSLTCGLILDTVTRGRREIKHLHYLSIPLVTGIELTDED